MSIGINPYEGSSVKRSNADLGIQKTPFRSLGTRMGPRERNRRREAVLAIAAQLFNEVGYHRTSLDAIAGRLGITKPALYYYFTGKDQILMECVKKGLQKTLEGVAVSQSAGGNAVDQLKACMAAYATVVTEPFGMCLIRVGDQDLPVSSRKQLRSIKAEIDRIFRRLIDQGIQERLLCPCNSKIAAFAVAGALSWIGRWYCPDGTQKAGEIVNQTVELLLAGLRADSTSACSDDA